MASTSLPALNQTLSTPTLGEWGPASNFTEQVSWMSQLDPNSLPSTEERVCSICRDHFDTNTNEVAGSESDRFTQRASEYVYTLCDSESKNNHIFHRLCLEKWFETRTANRQLLNCPECRFNFTPSQLSSSAASDSPEVALLEAAIEGEIGIVEELLARANLSAEVREEALMRAEGAGHWEIVKALLATEGIANETISWAFMRATRAGQWEIVESLLTTVSLSASAQGRALVLAAQAGKWRVVEAFLATANLSSSFLGEALMLAAKADQWGIVKAFLQNSGDFSEVSKPSLLLTALGAGEFRVMKLIFSKL